jgi:transposase-like protein
MDTNLIQMFEKFNSEDRCREYLELIRWPSGVCCVRCGDTSVSKLAKRHQYECNGCGYQFSATAGTMFHDSHLPLWKWFLAVYLMCVGIPMKVVSDSDLIPVTCSEVKAVVFGAKRRWRSYGA